MTVLFLSVNHGVGGRCFRAQAKKQGVGGVPRQVSVGYLPGQEAATASVEVAEGTSQ